MHLYLIFLSCVFDCQNAEWPECRPTGLIIMSRCQVMVSHMARVGSAATYCRFWWPAFRPVGLGIKASSLTHCNFQMIELNFCADALSPNSTSFNSPNIKMRLPPPPCDQNPGSAYVYSSFHFRLKPTCSASSDGTIYRIVSNIAILRSYRGISLSR